MFDNERGKTDNMLDFMHVGFGNGCGLESWTNN